MAQIKLGELLIKANVLTESQLKSALAEQQKWGGKLGEILVRMNILSEDLLVRALSKQLGIPAVNLDAVQGVPPHVKARVPADTARQLAALPLQLRDDGKTLLVAMAEPQDIQSMDTLRAVSKCKIIAQLAGRTQIARAFARFYEGEADVSDFEGSFKVVDSQGRTVVKSFKEIEAAEAAKQAAKPGPPVGKSPAPAMPPPAQPARGPVSMSDVPAQKASGTGSPVDLLKNVEDVQRKEVAALKAMVEILIEKGVFTREEYIAKVKR